MKIQFEISLRKNFIRLIYSSALLFTGFYFSTPYISILKFQSAIRNNESTVASRYIDFRSVRSSLKSQLRESANRAITNRIPINAYSTFGLIFIDPIINKIVDSTVTPFGLNLLLSQGTLIKSEQEIKSKRLNDKKENKIYSNSPDKPLIRLFYNNLNEFVVSSKTKDNQPIKAYLKRRGLFHWQLYKLYIPQKILEINNY